jgi:hypothetical protein
MNAKRLFAFFFVLTCSLIAIPSLADAQQRKRPELDDQVPLLDRQWSNDPLKFDFIVVGDKWSGGHDKWPIFDRAMAEINLLRPDFAITVGDMIPGHVVTREEWDAEWATFHSHADVLEVPLFLTPGNHDISNPEMYHLWREDFGSTYYSFDYMNCHFLVINTEEERFDGRGEVWNRMIEFVETDLSKSTDARHTFLFMHKPMWRDDRYEDDWARIDAALGARRFTAFAGHTHTLELDDTRPQRHIVVAATGGGISLSPLRELGEFDHYTKVVVDGDSVHLAIIEPGAMHAYDTARLTRVREIYGMATINPHPPTGLTTPRATFVVDVAYSNVLEDTVTITTKISGLDGSAWELSEGADSLAITLTPGERTDRRFTLTVPPGELGTPPSIVSSVIRGDEVLFRRGRVVPLAQESAMRVIPEWRVVGPFAIGDVQAQYLPDDPERAIPGLFTGEKANVLRPARYYVDNGDTLRWVTAAATSEGLLNFNGIIGTKDHVLGYAVAEVYSPRKQSIFIRMRADNFAQVLVNGTRVPEGDKWSGTGGIQYVRLPLKKGWNNLAVKLINNRGDWYLDVGVADPENELRFRLPR